MSEKYNRLMQMMAEQEAATGDMAFANSLNRAVAPGLGETLIDFSNKAIDKYAGILEKKKLKKEAEAEEEKKKKLLAQEKEEKRREWLLGEQIKTKREYGVPIPEIGVEDKRRYAPKADSLTYDMATGMLINKSAGTAKQITEGRPEKKMTDYNQAKETYARLQKAAANEAKTYTKQGGGMMGRTRWYKNGKEVQPFDANKYIEERLTPEQKKILGWWQKARKPALNPFGAAEYLKGAADSTAPAETVSIIRGQ